MHARAVVVNEGTLEETRGAVVAADTRTPDGRVALRKGTILGDQHAAALRSLLGRELHLIDLGPDEISQDAAADRLAAAAAGHGVRVARAAQGQARLRALHRGILRIRPEAIRAVNALYPLLCFTQPDGLVVLEGDEVAGAKSAALATPREVIERAEALFRSDGPPIAVHGFAPRRAYLVVTERLEAPGRDAVLATVQRKVSWYGSTLVGTAEVPHETAAVAEALRAALNGGADLFLVSGASSLDPLDPVLVALTQEGGRVMAAGIPAHPGSMVWVGQARPSVPVVGIANCAGFGKDTALDLLLPRILAGDDPAAAALAIGHGGFAEGPAAAGRFPPYERG